MLHYMTVNNNDFETIKNSDGVIAAVHNGKIALDPKKGDFIEVSCMNDPDRIVQSKICEVYSFNSFDELSAMCKKNQLSCISYDTAEPFNCDKGANYGIGSVLGLALCCTELQKYIYAQDHGYSFGKTYSTALSEIKCGYKSTHWMWYVFPQITLPGVTGITAYFSIKDLSEAKDYYSHPILGTRLLEITKELLNLDTDDPVSIFGSTDAFKLRVCMTLFKYAVPDQTLFQDVLKKFCQSIEDERTLDMIGQNDG